VLACFRTWKNAWDDEQNSSKLPAMDASDDIVSGKVANNTK
jgi:hypothetical protein